MVLITRSNVNEEPENRQPSVSKRFSKAIAAVPRARYQKALPKVPNIKRTDSNTNSNHTRTQKPIPVTNQSEHKQSTDKLESEKTTECIPSQTLSPENLTENHIPDSEKILNRPQKSVQATDLSNDKDKQLLNDVLPKKVAATTSPASSGDVSENKTNERKCSRIQDLTPGTNLLKRIKCYDETVSDKLKESEVIPITSQTNVASNGISDSEINSSSQTFIGSLLEELPSSSSHSKDDSNSETQACINETPDPLSKVCHETKKNVDTNALNDKEQSSVEVSEKESEINNSKLTHAENAATLNAQNYESIEALKRSSINRFVEEKRDGPASIPSTASERASKYPHLTSILSKKRTEPKKDAPKKRRKYRKGDTAPERSKMTMADLIYWNPTSSDPLGMKNTTNSQTDVPSSSNENILERSHEEEEEEVEDEVQNQEEDICESVPKLVISEDGTINIDQLSLVVSRKPELPVIELAKNEETTYSSFRKNPLSKHWTPKETYLFYKALSLCGTDFGLMEKLFPHRTRRELKLKFKREEKYNIDLVNRAMYESHLSFDADSLKEQIESLQMVTDDFELEQENNQPGEKKKRGRKPKVLTTNVESNDSVLQSSPISTAAKKKRGRKPKDMSSTVESNPVKSRPIVSGKAKVIDEANVKRKRKEKKMPEDFIDIDDVDIDITNFSLEDENVDDSLQLSCTIKESNVPESPSEDSVPYDDNSIMPLDDELVDSISNETTNIEIVCFTGGSTINLNPNNETIFVTEDESTIDLPEVINKIVQDIDVTPVPVQTECAIDLVSNNNSSGEMTVLTNVMANEIVTSVERPAKRKKKINETPEKNRKITIKKEPGQSVQPSSFNYTPIDDSLQDQEQLFTPKSNLRDFSQSKINLEFTPESNKRTYSKKDITPISQNMLISSLQTPLLTPEHSNALLTSLNMSNNRNIEIPMTPENNSSPNSVLLFAKSPSTDNVIHLFMYNNST